MTAQQRIRPDAHPTQYRKRRAEHTKVEEKDQADARAGYESEESRPRRKKGVRRVGGLWEIKKREVPVSFLMKLLIFHLHLRLNLHLHSLYLAALFPSRDDGMAFCHTVKSNSQNAYRPDN